MRTLHRACRHASLMVGVLVMSSVCAAQQSGTASSDQTAQDAPSDKPPLTQEELDQLAAPIALYPDALVAQILMASTYPLEVVEADRWIKKNSSLKGDALAKALESQTWDASVKSLVNFPQVLTMMSDELEWMTKLGDAFIEQQQQVMETVQSLRAKADAAGNLKTNEQQTVKVESQDNTQVIVIESKSPDVIYVPTYDPVVVYGAWPYPAYPPYHYYPPGYVAGTAALSFGIGVACGLAWGYAWGGCNWGHNDCHVDVNVNRNINRNTNINRTNINANVKNGTWQHDSSHRKGVSYRDSATAQKYGKTSSANAVQSREQFRGRAEAGQRDIQSGKVGGGTGSRGNAGGAGGAGGAGPRTRDAQPSGTAGDRSAKPSTRDTAKGSGSGGGAFSGSNRSGSDARASSSRGQSSRGASAGGGRSGGGGGGGRGGGGRR